MNNTYLVVLVLLFPVDSSPQVSADTLNDSLFEMISGDSLFTLQPDIAEQLVEDSDGEDESSALDLLEGMFNQRMKTVTVRSRGAKKLQPSRGFLNRVYKGSALKSYHRVTTVHESTLAAGVLVEKDPGETQMHDFTSAYISVHDLGPVRSIIFGDYLIEVGQGLLLWRPYDFRKGSQVVLPAKREERGVIPYTSSDENRFLRGLALEMSWSDLTFLTFYSRKFISTSLDAHGNVTSVYTAGYFRTLTETDKRGNTGETAFGGRGVYRLTNSDRLGITAYLTRYSRPFVLSNRFDGKEVMAGSLDYTFSLRRVKLFGEWGAMNSSVGGISGIHIEPGRSFDIICVYRHYPPGYFSLHNNGFGERSGTSSERGWYVGVQMRPVRRVRLSFFFDQFSFPATASSAMFPGGGHEIFAQADVTLLPQLLITSQVKRNVIAESKPIDDELGRATRVDDEKVKINYRVTLDYRLSKTTRLRSRYEYTTLAFRYLRRTEQGLVIYYDVVMKPLSTVSFNGRIVYFRTDSFDSRIGVYEPDLPGTLSTPLLYGKGLRWYILLRYSLSSSFHLSLKYSELMRDDVKTIGSGLDEIMVNRDNRLAIQLDVSL